MTCPKAASGSLTPLSLAPDPRVCPALLCPASNSQRQGRKDKWLAPVKQLILGRVPKGLVGRAKVHLPRMGEGSS